MLDGCLEGGLLAKRDGCVYTRGRRGSVSGEIREYRLNVTHGNHLEGCIDGCAVGTLDG